jgi:peptidoglycan/xylan/chitin deacetylase (PgdA/CDA1 family)
MKSGLRSKRSKISERGCVGVGDQPHSIAGKFNIRHSAPHIQRFRRWAFDVVLLLLCLSCVPLHASEFEFREGGIVRGPKNQKKIAFEFTGDSFAEGGPVILDALAKHNGKGSFFFTGKFLRNREFKPLIERIIKEGHYIGPHSDAHLLYCPWTGEKKTLVTKELFRSDLEKNLAGIEAFGLKRTQVKFWVPPYEWYNEEIVSWSNEMGMTLINFTPGTRSAVDYTPDEAKNFVSSQVIFDSILKKEKEDPNGLNGFLLLLHVGVGPKRTDKFHTRFGELLQVLDDKGYEFVRVDKFLGSGTR